MPEEPTPPSPAAPAALPSMGRAAWTVARPLLLGAVLGGLGVFVAVRLTPDLPAPLEAPVPRPAAAPAPKLAPETAPVAAPKPPAPALETVTITGSVADEFGRAIPDAIVLIARAVPPARPGSERPAVGELGVTDGPVPAIDDTLTAAAPKDAATTRTDQDGKFSVTGVELGQAQVFVSQPGYEPAIVSLEGLRAGETRDPLYIVLRTPAATDPALPSVPVDPRLARIGGIVLDRLGRGVPNARVQTDEGEASTRTDANGAFMLEGVAPGALRLMAEDETAGRGQSPEVRARTAETLEGVRVHLPGRHLAAADDGPTPSAPKARIAASAKPAPVLQGGLTVEQRANGAFVSLVDQSSPAGAAGLHAGDALLRIDDEAVLSATQARGMLRDPAGVTAKVQVLRGNKRLTLRWKRAPSRLEALR